jgi:hypothetical protein
MVLTMVCNTQNYWVLMMEKVQKPSNSVGNVCVCIVFESSQELTQVMLLINLYAIKSCFIPREPFMEVL